MRWKHTVNDILRNNWQTVEKLSLNKHQYRHLHNISKCHTEALGGTLVSCLDCDHLQYKYNSCRNRHCPSCQGSKREDWIARQQECLLDVPYFHVVFTLPSELRPLCMYKHRLMYTLLFRASWKTINTLSMDSKYLGAKTGMTAVLHTWSQNLSLHPHLHCIVPGGGVTQAGKWKATRIQGKYLFPAKVMAMVFRGIFLKELRALAKLGELPLDKALREKLYTTRWVVYAKRPFAKPAHVIEYLGRYTHKVAISNYRILQVRSTSVTFKWKDYRHGSVTKPMTLTIGEFIRRFALHILPHRFVRIRHYGILSNHGRSRVIPTLQEEQNYQPVLCLVVERPEMDTEHCQKCKSKNIKATVLLPVKSRAP